VLKNKRGFCLSPWLAVVSPRVQNIYFKTDRKASRGEKGRPDLFPFFCSFPATNGPRFSSEDEFRSLCRFRFFFETNAAPHHRGFPGTRTGFAHTLDGVNPESCGLDRVCFPDLSPESPKTEGLCSRFQFFPGIEGKSSGSTGLTQTPTHSLSKSEPHKPPNGDKPPVS